jgi:hypothetical protein
LEIQNTIIKYGDALTQTGDILDCNFVKISPNSQFILTSVYLEFIEGRNVKALINIFGNGYVTLEEVSILQKSQKFKAPLIINDFNISGISTIQIKKCQLTNIDKDENDAVILYSIDTGPGVNSKRNITISDTIFGRIATNASLFYFGGGNQTSGVKHIFFIIIIIII